MTGTDLANWITIVSGLVAAGFWLWSALVRVPDYVETTVNEPGSIPWIIKRQSRLSAVAAVFTAISVLAQAARGVVQVSNEIADEIRARRFVVVDANNKDLLDMWAAGSRLPTVTLYDVNGQPRTQLDLLPDGSPRLYFADANQRIRLRLGAASEGRSHIEIIDSNGQTVWEVPTPKK